MKFLARLIPYPRRDTPQQDRQGRKAAELERRHAENQRRLTLLERAAAVMERRQQAR